MDRDNRKSHLAPQLSPATQELLRSSDSPTYPSQVDGTLRTPTSGEIPILGAVMSPRDQYGSISNRSQARGGPGADSSGRTSGPSVHTGLGPRVTTSSSLPKTEQRTSAAEHAAGSRQRGGGVLASLPLRPAPSGVRPPPVREPVPAAEELARREEESRRQVTYDPASNGGYKFQTSS